jgi:GNAT superfamily N-acetyltransferase
VKALTLPEGLDFFLSTWKYNRLGSDKYLAKIISKHISGGVYENGNPVAGCAMNGHGLIGVLNTEKSSRRKGYGSLCMKFLLKEMAINGYVPVSTAMQTNHSAVVLHEKLGLKFSHECDFIFHVPY